MPVLLQITLVVFCLALLFLIVRQISKSRVIFSDFNYWILFSVFLIIMAVFPQITNTIAAVIGIQTPVVAIFLMVTFLLILLVLSCAFRISVLNRRSIQLTQKIAIMEEEMMHRIMKLEENKVEIEKKQVKNNNKPKKAIASANTKKSATKKVMLEKK